MNRDLQMTGKDMSAGGNPVVGVLTCNVGARV